MSCYQKKHSHSPILIIIQLLSASSIYYDPQHPPCSIFVLDSLFEQPLSTSSLVYLLVWSHRPHTPYISSPNKESSFHNTRPHHHNLFCCSINIISSIPSASINSLLGSWNSVFYLNTTHPSHHSHLCSLKCRLIFAAKKRVQNSLS